MFRTIATSALAIALASPVLADAHVTTTGDAATMDETATYIRSRDITGGPVYSIADSYDEASWMDMSDTTTYSGETMGYGSDLEQVGEIEDIILDSSGQMIGIVAEVGGFLDIGDKHVMLPVGDVRLVPVDDTTYSFVTRKSEDELTDMESVDEGWWN